jgi:hypothetical protein
MKKLTKITVLSSLFAALFCLSAQAALYSFNFNTPGVDSGPIPQGSTTFSVEHPITTGFDYSITSVQLILTFNDTSSLAGNSTGIEGLLNLGTQASSPFVNFFPTATSTSHGNGIYDVTWTGTSGTPGTGFTGLDPNNTWALVLFDHSNSGIENGLVSWTLNITAVPEPVTTALGIFGGVCLVVFLAKSRRVRARLQAWRVAAVRWVDAV